MSGWLRSIWIVLLALASTVSVQALNIARGRTDARVEVDLLVFKERNGPVTKDQLSSATGSYADVEL